MSWLAKETKVNSCSVTFVSIMPWLLHVMNGATRMERHGGTKDRLEQWTGWSKDHELTWST